MADRTGQTFGNYQLTQLLGRGGFADVYLGEHRRLGTQSAIKILHTHLHGSDETSFLTEARTIAHLEHPNIVRVLEFDIQEGVPYLVMSYAPNGSLRQLHPKGTRLPISQVSEYLKQIASALQYAHEQKFIHRDLKPENMLLSRNNELLLTDFGIALIAQSSRLLSTQEVIGTIQYMAPEQLQGKPHFASDQYALAILLYEWLTGQRPFGGNFFELYSQHLSVPPPSMLQKISSLSPDLDRVILTALSKEPAQRFGSIKAFATAFEQALSPSTPASPLPLVKSTDPTITVSPPTPIITSLASSSSPIHTWPTSVPDKIPFVKAADPEAPPLAIPEKKLAAKPKRSMRSVAVLVGLIILVPLISSLYILSSSYINNLTNPTTASITPTPNAPNTPQLPTPTSFKAAGSPEINLSLQYPADWQEEKPYLTQDNSYIGRLYPDPQLGIIFNYLRLSEQTSATIDNPDQLNSQTLAQLSEDQGFTNFKDIPATNQQPTIAGTQWSQRDVSAVDTSNNVTSHFTAIAVKRGITYYQILLVAPDAIYNEAMQKYFQPMLDSLKFLS